MFEEECRPKILIESVQEVIKDFCIAIVFTLIIFYLTPYWLRWLCLHFWALLLLSGFIANFISTWKSRKRISPERKSVFITGCGSGFGKLLAQKLDDLGFNVFAGCHHPEGHGALDLKKYSSHKLHIVPIDITSEESVNKALLFVKSKLNNTKLWALVNNAGMLETGEILWINMDTIYKNMETIALGMVRVTKAFLPLICSSEGRIINISSSGGRYTIPRCVPYCMGKYVTISFTEGLRMEMYRFRVKVISIEPFLYKTKMSDANRIVKCLTKEWKNVSGDVKKLYPDNYWRWFERTLKRSATLNASEKLEEVVDCIEEAIMAVNPKLSYTPGPIFSKCVLWLLLHLPKQISDFLANELIENELFCERLHSFVS